MSYNYRDPLFNTLYDIKALQNLDSCIDVEEVEKGCEGNLVGVEMSFELIVRGIRELKVILSCVWEPSTGKGFIASTDFRASATIGQAREDMIHHLLREMFLPYALLADQPEGTYEHFGQYAYDRASYFVKRIAKSEMAPLYYTNDDSADGTTTVSRYESFIIQEYKHGHDFIDENNQRYRILRTISDFEYQHGMFLFCVQQRNFRYDSYVAYVDVNESEKQKIHVLSDTLLIPPPTLPPGTVLYDKEERQYVQLVEHEGSIHLQYEQKSYVDAYEPFVFSDRFKVVTDVDFEIEDRGFYFDEKDRVIYQAVFRRPHYLVVRMPDGSPFEHTRWRETSPTGVVPLSQLQHVNVDYDRLTRTGIGFSNTSEGQIIHDLIGRTHAIRDCQEPFWVGLSVEYYGSLTRACHTFYFRLIDHIKYSSSGAAEMTEFLRELLSNRVIQMSA